MTDSIKPLSLESLTLLAKKILVILTSLWVVSVFPLFIFTDAFYTTLVSLVQSGHAGGTNIITLIASDVQTAAPEIYIQKYFTLFIQARAAFFFLFTSLLVYLYFRFLPATFRLLLSVFLPAILLGFTTSLRILGPFAGLIVVYHALRTVGKTSLPTLGVYALIAIIAMYVTWPYLWMDPVGRFWESIETMSAYPWKGLVLYNGVEYQSTALPYSYLPVLFGIQLTEPVWVLSIVGVAASVIGRNRKWEVIELTILWFIIPLLGFIILRSAIYDNFRQIFFILPPVFWLAGAAFEKIKNLKWQMAVMALCLLPGVLGIIRLHPYEYIYYNSFIGGVDGAVGRFELDYWGISYREAAEYVNEIAPANSIVWVEGPSHLFGLFAREDLKIYSTHEIERADYYDYVVATTRRNMDKTSFPDAEVIHKIARGEAVLTVIKQP